MTKEDIVHLGNLARIKLSEEEVVVFNQDIEAILNYVSVVKNIAADAESASKEVGAVFNILREDEVTNEPGTFSEILLEAMPHRDGQFMAVKKILQPSQ